MGGGEGSFFILFYFIFFSYLFVIKVRLYVEYGRRFFYFFFVGC